MGLGGHVVIGVGRVVVHRHHADAKPSVESFLLDVAILVVVRLNSVIVNFHLKPNCCTLLHRENGSFEVLSLQKLDVKRHSNHNYSTPD